MKAAFKRSVDETWEGEQQFISTAKKLLQSQRPREALSLLRRGMKVYPCEQAEMLMGKAYLALNQLTEARWVFEKLLSNKYRKLEVYILLARTCLAQRDISATLSVLGQAKKQYPQLPMLNALIEKISTRAQQFSLNGIDTIREEPLSHSDGEWSGSKISTIVHLNSPDLQRAPGSTEQIPSGQLMQGMASIPAKVFTEGSNPFHLRRVRSSIHTCFRKARLKRNRKAPVQLSQLTTLRRESYSSLCMTRVKSKENRPLSEAAEVKECRPPTYLRYTRERLPRLSSAHMGRRITSQVGQDERNNNVIKQLEREIDSSSSSACHLSLISKSDSTKMPTVPNPGRRKTNKSSGKGSLTNDASTILRSPRHKRWSPKVLTPLLPDNSKEFIYSWPKKWLLRTLSRGRRVTQLLKQKGMLRLSLRCWPLVLIIGLSLVLASLAAINFRQKELAAVKLAEARKLSELGDSGSLKTALNKLRDAANIVGRKPAIITLAAAIHGRLAVEFGESEMDHVKTLVEESDRLEEQLPQQSSEDLAIARSYFYLGRGPLSLALRHLQAGLKKFPNHPRMQLLYAEALSSNQDYQLAEQILQKLPAQSGPVIHARAQLQWLQGKRQESLSLLKYGEQLGLATADFKLRLLQYQLEEKLITAKNRLALQKLTQSSDLPMKQRSWAYLLYAMLFHEEGLADQAQITFERALAYHPTAVDPEFNYRASQLLLAANHCDRAQEFIAEAVRVSPRDLRYATQLAQIKLAMHQPQAAIQQLLSVRPLDSSGWMILAEAYLNIGDLNEARQALKAVPNILLARRNFLRARLYLAEGNTQLALQEIAGIHPGKRDRAELYVVGGIIAFQMGDMERAQRLLKAAIEEDPSRSEAWWKLGSIARQKGELPSAQQLFERAVSLDPYAVEIRLEFGNLLLKLGAIAEAGRQFDEVLALDAENVTALAGRARVAAESDSHDPLGHIEAVRSKGYPTLASLLTARYHMTRGEWQQASQELSHLLAVPLVDRNEAVVWLAISLRQEGKLAQAISTLESVLRQDWNNPEAHISLSEVNVWRGKMEEAKLHAIVAQDLLAKTLQTPALKDRLSLLLARCQQNSASLRRTLQELSNKIEITSGPTTPNLELKLLYTFLKQETSSKSPLAMADGSKK